MALSMMLSMSFNAPPYLGTTVHADAKKGRRIIASLSLRNGLRERGFGLFRDLAKGRLVMHGDVCEHLAIDVDRCFLQTVHEYAVRHSEFAGRRIDTRDPQCPELAFFLATVAVLILPRLHHRLLGDAEDVTAATAVALGEADDLLVTCSGGYAPFDAWHLILSL